MSSDSAKDNASRSGRRNYEEFSNLSPKKRAKRYRERYFVIKSLNHQNLQLSIEKGIWATQLMNEPILEEAYNNSSKVILIFSVNMSGCFQGYAEMNSRIGWRRDNIWSKGSGKLAQWGRSFKVKWLSYGELPFQKTVNLKNPLNDYKPVKISRDCQELTDEIGQALCELIDLESNYGGPFSRTEQLNPFMLQQYWEAGEIPYSGALTDDDLLEMTYEEYLEAHNKTIRQFNLQWCGSSNPIERSSRSGTSEELETGSLQLKD